MPFEVPDLPASAQVETDALALGVSPPTMVAVADALFENGILKVLCKQGGRDDHWGHLLRADGASTGTRRDLVAARSPCNGDLAGRRLVLCNHIETVFYQRAFDFLGASDVSKIASQPDLGCTYLAVGLSASPAVPSNLVGSGVVDKTETKLLQAVLLRSITLGAAQAEQCGNREETGEVHSAGDCDKTSVFRGGDEHDCVWSK